MGMISRYPIDPDRLHKGQVITIEELETLVGFARTLERFRLGVVVIQNYINTRTEMTAVFRRDGLHILTDSQASGYNDRRFHIGLDHVYNRHQKSAQVDMSNLSPPEAQEHVRNLAKQARIVAGVTAIRRQIVLDAHRRTLPGKLPEHDQEPDPGSARPEEKPQ